MRDFIFPFIDAEQTSLRLKLLRKKNGLRISDLQRIFNMENPQALYAWESSSNKTLPRLDNLVVLARLYQVSLDDLVMVKIPSQNADSASAESAMPPYGWRAEEETTLLAA